MSEVYWQRLVQQLIRRERDRNETSRTNEMKPLQLSIEAVPRNSQTFKVALTAVRQKKQSRPTIRQERIASNSDQFT